MKVGEKLKNTLLDVAKNFDKMSDSEKAEANDNIRKQFDNIIHGNPPKTEREKEIDKLAMENARYMISVFTPTVMEYTIPYNRAILTCGWLYELADTIETFVDEHPKVLPKISKYDYFYDRVKDECNELADLISGQNKKKKNDHILDDHKKIGIEFFRTFGALYKANMNGKESVDMLSKFKFDNIVSLLF